VGDDRTRPESRWSGLLGTAHPRAALVGALLVLLVWNVAARPALPSSWHVEGGLVVALVMVWLGTWGGLSLTELGLSRRRVRSGLRYGLAAVVAVTGVVLLGLVSPWTHHAFHTARADVGASQLLLELLVTIPLGTVVVEELAFRGTLLGLLRQHLSQRRAVVVCSVLFGLWHIDGVIRATAGTATHVLAATVGTFTATALAGVAFSWLRLRSGSLLAPALAHWATNTVALLLAWFVAQ
jgi:uncharacterized protein